MATRSWRNPWWSASRRQVALCVCITGLEMKSSRFWPLRTRNVVANSQVLVGAIWRRPTSFNYVVNFELVANLATAWKLLVGSRITILVALATASVAISSPETSAPLPLVSVLRYGIASRSNGHRSNTYMTSLHDTSIGQRSSPRTIKRVSAVSVKRELQENV